MRRTALVVFSVLALVACSAAPLQTATPSTPAARSTAAETALPTPTAVSSPTPGPSTPKPAATATSITSAPPTPVATPSVTPTWTPTPTAPGSLASGLNDHPNDVLVLKQDEIRSVTADVSGEEHQLAQDGPHVAFIDDSGVELADLRDESRTLIAKQMSSDIPWRIDMSGNNVVWLSGYFEGSTDPHCYGPLHWRINVFDIATGATQVIAAGVSKRMSGCSVWPPPVAIDGDLVAYAVEDPSASEPEASTVIVRSITTDEVVRTIESSDVVEDVDIDVGDVAFVAGSYTPDAQNYWYVLADRQLMLSTVSNPTPVLVARDLDDVSFSNGRLAWLQTPISPADHVMTTTVADLDLLEVGERAAPFWRDPVSSGRFVSFVANDLLWVWDDKTGAAHPMQAPAYPKLVSTNGGWLVWQGVALKDSDPAVLQGLPIDDVPGMAQ